MMNLPIPFAILTISMTWFLYYVVPILGFYVIVSMIQRYVREV